MEKGIVLFAFGDVKSARGYGFMAYNMAFSIKKFNPDLHITLFHDQNAVNELHDDWKEYFDEMISLDEELFYNDGKLDPCKLKIGMYDLLPYKNNLYLDVDGIALSDIEPIIDDCIKQGGFYYTQITENGITWAKEDDVKEHFEIEGKLPQSQTSIQFVKKCDEAKQFYENLKKNYDNPIGIEKLIYTWGGGQADELYVNVTLTQMGFDAKMKPVIFFGDRFDPRPITELEKEYKLLSIFGGKEKTKGIYRDWYDGSLMRWHHEIGKEYATKSVYFLSTKFANNSKPVQLPRIVTDLKTALLPISKTVLIDSKKLIQEYKLINGGMMKVTNWFNCSAIEYRGKIYFAYRMEARPFCVNIRIGLCELDKNYQPIQNTNSLLELHTDIKLPNGSKPFAKGYHAEDPRLFVFNDELHISYTDGYQMAQGKINVQTMQAEESFYINKPSRGRTEKNWTFFEHENELYSVYAFSPHTIFKMNGENWEQVHRTPFSFKWEWGEVRGGSTPIKAEDKFVSFFHSAMPVKYKNQEGRQYFMGMYEFEAKPPFRVLRMSNEPILTGEIVLDNIPRLSNKIFVVFPNGSVRKENSWIVSLGYNDYQCRYIELEDEFLESNLVDIKQEKLIEA